MANFNITTKAGRSALAERMEPYWYPLRKGVALGYRAKATGSWIVRSRDDRTGKQQYRALGSHADFSAARTAALEWLATLDTTVHRVASRGTVRDALCAYVKHKRLIGRRASAWDAGQRFRLTVGRTSDFGRMRLEDVRSEDVEAWRNGLRKGRKPRSVNRQVRSVIAALNYAVSHAGHVGRREAWKLEHLVDDGEKSVAVFLTGEQRDRIIAHSPKPLAALLTGFTHTGARPSELARATVADFDAKGGTVTFSHYKGRGGKLRIRATTLSDAGAAFFTKQARGKLPQAPLISNDEGKHWTDQQWCAGIEKAITAANDAAKKPAQRIPKGASAYSFRHTRISELLQVYGVDPLTVAQQTGTGLTMIEQYYFKFISGSMRDKLNAVKAS
ncbi:MAG: site-specific integrase [Candidatus Eremiobacteraeota bacterium]|nr:site-specific integrase [Candidatus Eremiobacteraeota bacterium]